MIILPVFAAASIIVQLSMNHPIAIFCLMVFLTFITIMLGAIDARYRTIAFGTLIIALYTTLTRQPNLAWYVNPVMLTCGVILFHGITLGLNI